MVERSVEGEENEWEEEYVYIDLVGMVDPDKLGLCTKENTAVLVRLFFLTLPSCPFERADSRDLVWYSELHFRITLYTSRTVRVRLIKLHIHPAYIQPPSLHVKRHLSDYGSDHFSEFS